MEGVTPRPAATVVLVRPAAGEPEVLMLERPARGFFGGLWVFPGGGVEPIDHEELAASTMIVPPETDDLPWRAAALREMAEEVGLALTDPPIDVPVTLLGAAVYREVQAHRARFDGRRLRLLSQWVTPEGAPTRFDARFYLARVDGDPLLSIQAGEVIDTAWITAAEALDRLERQEWMMVTPTIHHLRWLTRYSDVDAIWDAAGEASGARVEPTVEFDGSEVKVQLPAAAELP